MANSFNLRATEAHFKRVLLYAPGLLGNEAVNFFTNSFRLQGWLGNRLEPWRKRRSRKRAGRAVLVQSGRLRRGTRIVSNTGGVVRIGNDVPYARAHNEGFRGVVSVAAHQRGLYRKNKVGTGRLTKRGRERMKTVSSRTGAVTVKAHTRRMNLPRRRFMGQSPYLTAILKRKLQAELNKGLR